MIINEYGYDVIKVDGVIKIIPRKPPKKSPEKPLVSKKKRHKEPWRDKLPSKKSFERLKAKNEDLKSQVKFLKSEIKALNKNFKSEIKTLNKKIDELSSVEIKITELTQYGAQAKNRGKWNRIKKGKCSAKTCIEFMGCDFHSFRLYMQSRFVDGMSWDNYGEWEYDHKIPMSSFDLTVASERDACNHYTNIQPLWKWENAAKGNR